MRKKQKNNLLLFAAIGLGIYILLQNKQKKGSLAIPQNKASTASPQEKSTPGTNSAMRTLYLDYIKQFLIREDYSKSPDGYQVYEKLFSSMTTDELEASYLYLKDFGFPSNSSGFYPGLDPGSPLGTRIAAIRHKYKIF